MYKYYGGHKYDSNKRDSGYKSTLPLDIWKEETQKVSINCKKNGLNHVCALMSYLRYFAYWGSFPLIKNEKIGWNSTTSTKKHVHSREDTYNIEDTWCS